MLLLEANPQIMQIVLFGGIFVVFYFFMIRPQQKKAKEAQKFISELKTGDKVVTIGGAHGSVVSIREKTIVVEVDSSKGVRMVFEKSAISKDASSRLTEE
ncbi:MULTISPECIES: preprotein translocase subunit YajC [Aquirufa]|jgi:preprotein translocase subunit YajC|uniref:Sec translocon accessory complex subunit YajC n=1 Tax=Aquirufa regiilacus TaxID=3024868 RepID=A0ABU3TPD9_9BACT|nr:MULTISPECIES: preprotein translocase subunit YajC [unclassified Aquirufa]MBP6055113.1 preprotein translocase subunit YajC [Cytophagaceae bacterium]MBP6093605.1 preprotein translocase subunit YajC [Cytophagaceae bacterium]MDT8886997.1 preprotein translocase subunit YajC [Aquirufa sp. LEPPI-3A]MDU0807726.1 preprotein translocase subunit YajC [Aquirufa sp. LEOWEIH-7C]